MIGFRTALVALLCGVLAAVSGAQVRQSSIPLDCPEYVWAGGRTPYDLPGGPPRRYLILSNGPENILDAYIPAGSDHVNVYWGVIPFEGTDLRLRVYISHILDANAKLDNAEVRFCIGVRGTGASASTGVRIVRNDSTIGTAVAGMYQYIDPGKMLALAHLGQNWQTRLPAGTTVEVPPESESGDVTGLAVTLRKDPVTSRYGNLVGEIDLKADHPMTGRSLVVRTVLRMAGGGLGISRDETCSDSGAGERGWWPQADIFVSSDPARPVSIRPRSMSPYVASFRMCERGHADWAVFNDLTADKKAAKTNNPLDRYGTKNSGLWGVNVLYRVYYRGGGDQFTAFHAGIAGLLTGAPAGHAFAGPFGDGDAPWSAYMSGNLHARDPGYVNRRSPTDFDLAELGDMGIADESVRYFEFFLANIGDSEFPTALVIECAKKPAGLASLRIR